MKEHPILFSGPLVRAILAGQKTVTRRVVDAARLRVNVPRLVPLHIPFEVPGKRSDMSIAPGTYRATMNEHGAVSVVLRGERVGVKPDEFQWASPYGAPGDHLWVRETWAPGGATRPGAGELNPQNPAQAAFYRADGEALPETWSGWCPSIHMPRWASRLTLAVEDVRVERLHDITEADARAEGVDAVSVADVPRNGTLSCVADFAQLWEKINGKGSWALNPWVWRVAFEVLPGGGRG